jgi:hypothetical protein
MKATNFQLELPGVPGSREGQPLSSAEAVARQAAPDAPRLGVMERLDRWLWRQEVRQREAYLADAKDIYELEERIRRYERSVGSRYY